MTTFIKHTFTGLAAIAALLFCSTMPTMAQEIKPDYIAHKVTTAPTFDGVGNDAVWENAEWYNIDQTWLPYNNLTDAELIAQYPKAQYPNFTRDAANKPITGPDDFSGKFKLLWSETENVLYMLAEIVDDVFVDGYVAGNSGYPDFDILELFVDENKSGGRHVFNTGSELASNAFSYHLAVDAIEDAVQTKMCAMDLVGPGWEDYANYADHFTAFAMRRTGTTSVYELALKFYSDQYDISKTTEGNAARRVTLAENKQIGLAVAYCDNDTKTSGSKREHFIGSVHLDPNDNNSCWENADPYGTLLLAGEKVIVPPISIEGAEYAKLASIYPNPATDVINLTIAESYSGSVKADLYTITGSLVSTLYNGNAQPSLQLPASELASGNYICVITTDNGTESIKVMIK